MATQVERGSGASGASGAEGKGDSPDTKAEKAAQDAEREANRAREAAEEARRAAEEASRARTAEAARDAEARATRAQAAAQKALAQAEAAKLRAQAALAEAKAQARTAKGPAQAQAQARVKKAEAAVARAEAAVTRATVATRAATTATNGARTERLRGNGSSFTSKAQGATQASQLSGEAPRPVVPARTGTGGPALAPFRLSGFVASVTGAAASGLRQAREAVDTGGTRSTSVTPAGTVVVPKDVKPVTAPVAGDPAGVQRVAVKDLAEPLRSQLLAAHTVQKNTGAGSGVSIVERGGQLLVAMDKDRELVSIAKGKATEFQAGTANTLSVFLKADMRCTSSVQAAFQEALKLTQGQTPMVPLKPAAPLTPDQVTAYQSLGYTVAVLDPAHGHSAVRAPGAPGGADVANIGAEPGARPVYVLLGGPQPAIPGLEKLPPERVAELQQSVTGLREQYGPHPTLQFFSGEEVGLSAQSAPAEWAVFTHSVVREFPPRHALEDPASAHPLRVLVGTLDSLEGGQAEESRAAAAGLLAHDALHPEGLPGNPYPAELAASALALADNTPASAVRLLDSLGPEGATALLKPLALDYGEHTQPTPWSDDGAVYGYQMLTKFTEQLKDTPPSPARDAFNLALLDPAYNWGQPVGNDIHRAAVSAWTGRFMAMPEGPEKTAAAQEYFTYASSEMWTQPGFSQELAGTMASAMSGDPARQAQLRTQLGGIFASEAGPQLFGDRAAPEMRVRLLEVFANHPEYDAAWLAKNPGPDGTVWTHPGLMKELAAQDAAPYLSGRGDTPVSVSTTGASLDNLVGQGFGLPPSASDLEGFFNGTANGYTQPPASGVVGPVAGKIRDWAKQQGVTDVNVTVLPLQVSSSAYGTATLPLFRVDDPKRPGQHVYFDNQGNRYRDFEHWKTANTLPPGTVVYPKDGKLTPGTGGAPELVAANTPKTPDTFQERAFQTLDTLALVGGVIAGGAIVIGSGGTLAPAVAAGASAWGAYRAAEGLYEQSDLGHSLNPFENPQAGLLWLDLGANVIGLGSLAAEYRAAKLAAGVAAGTGTPADVAASAARFAQKLDFLGAGADGVGAVANGAYAFANWDKLSEGDRAAALSQMVFFGVLSTAQATAALRHGPDSVLPKGPTAFESFPGSAEALSILQRDGRGGWRSLVSKHDDATVKLLSDFRSHVVVDAINRTVAKIEGKWPDPPCTLDALQDGGWRSPSGILFKNSGSTNKASDFDVSIIGTDSTPLSRLMSTFDDAIEDGIGMPASVLLDTNALDGNGLPLGDSWRAISADVNAVERQYLQVKALLSADNAGALQRMAEASGFKLDPQAFPVAAEMRRLLDQGVEALRGEYPRLSQKQLENLAGYNIYQASLDNMDFLNGQRDELIQRINANGVRYDPATGSQAKLTPAEARELNALNVDILKEQMRARLFASDSYTAHSTFIDIVDNSQQGSAIPLTPEQYRVSAQENVWNAVEHLGEGSLQGRIDSSKYVARTLKALAASQPDSEAAGIIRNILTDKEGGLGQLLALREAGLHGEKTLPTDTAATTGRASAELDGQLRQVLEALGTDLNTLPSTSTQDMLMALWVHAAR